MEEYIPRDLRAIGEIEEEDEEKEAPFLIKNEKFEFDLNEGGNLTVGALTALSPAVIRARGASP